MSVAFVYLGSCTKIINFLLRQKKLETILNMFRNEICHPKTLKETNIVSKSIKIIDFMTKTLLVEAEFAGIIFLLLPFLTPKGGKINLPFKSYQPYNIENSINFTLTYIGQIIGAILCVYIYILLYRLYNLDLFIYVLYNLNYVVSEYIIRKKKVI
jgi:hypothetical protein